MTRHGLLLVALALAQVASGPAAGQALPPRESASSDAGSPARASEDARSSPGEGSAATRYLYVPYPDLDAVLDPGEKGVMLSRDEYDRLWREALGAAEQLRLAGRPPVQAALLEAAYTGHVGERQALIEAQLSVEVLGSTGGTVVLPLDLAGAAIDAATLDGEPALLGRDAQGRLRLFIPDAAPGRRTLRLKLVARVLARTHDSIVRLTLPRAPAAAMTLTFDSDVEVAASAPIVERTYDEAANRTTVRLIPVSREVGVAPLRSGVLSPSPPRGEGEGEGRGHSSWNVPNPHPALSLEGRGFPPAAAPQPPAEGPFDLVLTFVPNDIRRERTPVLVSDVTALARVVEGHVQVEATFAYTVLRKDVDEFVLTLPADLAVNEVSEADLLSWSVAHPPPGVRPDAQPGAAGPQVQRLTVRLHQPRSAARVRVVVHAPLAKLGPWSFPAMATEGAAIERGVLALALPPDIRARDETLTNARRVRGLFGGAARPPTGVSVPAQQRAVGAQTTTRSDIVREYAFWQQPYACTVDLEQVPAEVVGFNNMVLRLTEQELQLTTQVTVVPRAGRAYQVRVRIPAEWDVIAVSSSRPADQYAWQELKPRQAAGKDILVSLRERLAVGEALMVTIDARLAPEDWVERQWAKRDVTIPEVRLLDVATVEGQFGVWADPEFSVTPADLVGLEAVDVRELKELNGGNLALGYRFGAEKPPAGRLAVARLDPRVQVEAVGYASLSEGVLRSAFQLNYAIERAGTDTFRFVVLPGESPAAPAAAAKSPTGGKIVVQGVRPPDGSSAVTVKDWDRLKDYPGPGEAWTVHTQKRYRGQVSLLVTFERDLPDTGSAIAPETLSPPGRGVGEGPPPVSQADVSPSPRPLPPGRGGDVGGPLPQGRGGADVGVPTLRILDVERQSGYLLVEGRDDVELTCRPLGLTEVSPSEVPAIAYRAGRVLTAYRYLSLPIGLTLAQKRHAEAEIPKALIRRAVLTSVVERSGECRTRAVYLVGMAQPAPLRVTLPEGATLWTALVAGEPVKPQVIENVLAIPIEKATAGGVEVSLLYVQKVSLKRVPPVGWLTLEPPKVEGIEIAEADWDLYLPEEFRYLAARGTMHLSARPAEPLAIAQAWKALRDLVGALAPARAAARMGGDIYYYEPDAIPVLAGPADRNAWLTYDGALKALDLDLRDTGYRAHDDVDFIEGVPAPDAYLRLEQWGEAPGDLREMPVRPPPTPSPATPPLATASEIAGWETAPAAPPSVQAIPEAASGYFGAARRGLMTLRVPLTVTGQRYRFHRLDGTGTAGIAYLPLGFHRFLTFAAFGAVLVVGVLFGALKVRRKLLYVLFILIAATVLPSFIGEGFSALANGGFWGALVVAGWYLLRWLGRVLVRAFGWLAHEFDHAPALAGAMRAIIVVVVVLLILGGLTASGAPVVPGEGRLGESAVVVPYDPAHPERALESDRVYLPYSRYVELWNLVHPDRPLRPETPPPADYVIQSAAYYGRLAVEENDKGERSARVAFEAEFRIHVLKAGFTQVPLALGGVAVREATLDGQPATLQADAQGCRLQLAAPGDHVVRVLFVARATAPEGLGQTADAWNAALLARTGRCAFSIPPVPASILELTVPEDLEVTVSNALGGQAERPAAGGVLVQAHLGPAEALEFAWQPRVKPAEREMSISATVANLVTIEESVTRLAAAVRYDVAQGERRQFTLVLPADLEIERVVGENVRTWRVVTVEPEGAETLSPPGRGMGEGPRPLPSSKPAPSPRPLPPRERGTAGKTLELVLHRPATATFEATIHGYRAAAGGAAAPVTGAYALPLITTADAGRETGQVGVRVAPALRLVVGTLTGLEQMNVSEFGGPLLDKAEVVQPLLGGLAYRYARRPAAMTVTVDRQTTRVRAEVRTAVHVRKEEVNVRAQAALTVEGLGANAFRFEVPADISSPSVAAADGRGDNLENWYVTKDAGGSILTVNLARPIVGQAQVTISGNLPKPAADAAFALPQVTLVEAERQTGLVAVSVAAGLEVYAADLTGLSAVPAATLADWARPEADERLVLGFRVSDPRPSATLRPRFLSPRVTAESVSHLLIADTFIAHRFVIGYLVENAGVGQFRFSLPAALGESVEVTGERIRQTASTVEGIGADARRVWTVTMQGEVLGPYRLFVYHEGPAPTGDRLAVPRVDVLDVERSRNFIAVQNDSRLEVRPRRVTVAESVPASELPILPQGIRSADVLSAYRCINGLWAIDLDLVAHEGQRIQRDVVELMDVVTVVERDGRARSQVTYRLNNQGQQFLELAMPAESTLWGATVADRPVKPAAATRAGQRLLLVPLIKTAPEDLNYDAVVVFEGRIQGGFGAWGRSISPVVPRVVSMPVNKTVVTLYLPPDFIYFNDRGNLDRAVASQREAEQLAVLLKEQERLQQQARFGKGAAQWSAWDNFKYQLSDINQRLAVLDRSNSMVLEEASGLLAGRERGLARQQQDRIEALREQVEVFNRAEAARPARPEDQPAAQPAADQLGQVRSNVWALNPDQRAPADEKSGRLWKGEEVEGPPARPGAQPTQRQAGEQFQRWFGRTQDKAREKDLQAEQDRLLTEGRDVGGQVIRLRNAEVGDLARTLNELFRGRQAASGAARTSGELAAKKGTQVTIQADQANNALIVRADPESLAAVQELVRQLDTTAAAARHEVRVFNLKNADANQLSAILNQTLGGGEAQRRGRAGEPTRANITADERTNTVIVAGTAEQLRQIDGLVQQLDAAEAVNGHFATGIPQPGLPAGRPARRPESEVWRAGSDFAHAGQSYSRTPLATAAVPPGPPTPEGEARPAGAGGLLSLAIQIPRYGTRLDFVKTLGEPDLTLSVVDRRLVQMAVAAGVGLVALVVVLLITSWRGMVRLGRCLRVAIPLAMAVAGIWSAAVGFYAGVSIAVAAAGLALLGWWLAARLRRRAALRAA